MEEKKETIFATDNIIGLYEEIKDVLRGHSDFLVGEEAAALALATAEMILTSWRTDDHGIDAKVKVFSDLLAAAIEDIKADKKG